MHGLALIPLWVSYTIFDVRLPPLSNLNGVGMCVQSKFGSLGSSNVSLLREFRPCCTGVQTSNSKLEVGISSSSFELEAWSRQRRRHDLEARGPMFRLSSPPLPSFLFPSLALLFNGVWGITLRKNSELMLTQFGLRNQHPGAPGFML